MARYIGARYVPIPGGAWDNTREYEPLTMVQYEGDTYTSKIYVPVGVAITNTTYWVKTGNFNQQIAYINGRMQDAEQEIDNIQGDINDILGNMSGLGNRFIVHTEGLLVNEAAPDTNAGATSELTYQPTRYIPLGVVGYRTAVLNLDILRMEIKLDTSTDTWKKYITFQHHNQSTIPVAIDMNILYFDTEGL